MSAELTTAPRLVEEHFEAVNLACTSDQLTSRDGTICVHILIVDTRLERHMVVAGNRGKLPSLVNSLHTEQLEVIKQQQQQGFEEAWIQVR